jgi:hypothetical protein
MHILFPICDAYPIRIVCVGLIAIKHKTKSTSPEVAARLKEIEGSLEEES